MIISVASDHGGFQLKSQVVEYLLGKGFQVIDRGCPSIERVDYPEYAKYVCEDIQNKVCDFGVLICTTGVGMSIYANKFVGIRAALVTNLDVAHLTRMHNDSNVICMGAKYTKPEDAFQFVEVFVNEKFEGGRHTKRVCMINDKEKKL